MELKYTLTEVLFFIPLSFFKIFPGSYKGQWLRGMRHGYGIRTSAPWSVATPNNHQHHSEQQQKHRGGHTSLSSLRSNYGSVAMLDDERAATAMDTPPNHHGRSHSRERRGEQTIQLGKVFASIFGVFTIRHKKSGNYVRKTVLSIVLNLTVLVL